MREKRPKNPYADGSGAGLAKAKPERADPPRPAPQRPVRQRPAPLEAQRPSRKPATPREPAEPVPASNIGGAILTLILCNPLFGLVALLYAIQVKPRWKRGNAQGAEHASRMSEIWLFAGVGVAVIVWVILAIVYGVTSFLNRPPS